MGAGSGKTRRARSEREAAGKPIHPLTRPLGIGERVSDNEGDGGAITMAELTKSGRVSCGLRWDSGAVARQVFGDKLTAEPTEGAVLDMLARLVTIEPRLLTQSMREAIGASESDEPVVAQVVRVGPDESDSRNPATLPLTISLSFYENGGSVFGGFGLRDVAPLTASYRPDVATVGF